ncbi:MAG: dihydrodipicolinate synthase family protein [Pirellulaceae bacterium]|nr:dihydrodipicolinate synthase family protein [Pirellulaceae bacterium]
MSRAVRVSLQQKLFPSGIPRLWCPTITHFRDARTPDESSIREHLERIAPVVKGILVPGSTGEGWEMEDDDVRSLLDIVLPIAQDAGIHVLIGVLKTRIDEVVATLAALDETINHPAVVGTTICPPRGSELTQSEIADGLRQILSFGIPTALYQLPQITMNEMAPATVASLAREFSNFILFKDTSGKDRVAQSNVDLEGVFLVRGSEHEGYAKWPRSAGGPYDGFLLSSSNAFATELNRILELLDAGDFEQANKLSEQIEAIISRTFELVQAVHNGNPFANANKLLDHVRKHGRRSLDFPPPMLFCGTRLSTDLIEGTQRIIEEYLVSID